MAAPATLYFWFPVSHNSVSTATPMTMFNLLPPTAFATPASVGGLPHRPLPSTSPRRLSIRTPRTYPQRFTPRSSSATPDNAAASPNTTPPPSSPSETPFTFSIGSSSLPTLQDAIPDAVRQAARPLALNRVRASLVLVFVRSAFEDNARDNVQNCLPSLKKALSFSGVIDASSVFFGCTTADAAATDRRAQGAETKITLALLHLPQPSALHVTHVRDTEFSLDWRPSQWAEFLRPPESIAAAAAAACSAAASTVGTTPETTAPPSGVPPRYIFLLYHPDFSPRLRDLLCGLDFALPGVRKLGCAAGRATPLHDAQLLCGGDGGGALDDGALLLQVWSGPSLQVDVSAAQGARGVGRLLEICELRDDGHEVARVRALADAAATEAAPMVLLDMWARTDVIAQEDARLAGKYLMLGTEVADAAGAALAEAAAAAAQKDAGKQSSSTSEKEDREREERSRAVVLHSRRVVGFNDVTNSLAVEEGAPLRLGTRAQLQIRDEEAARGELSALFDRLALEASSKAMEGMSLMGGLLLVDSERGEALHGNINPDLDAVMYRERFGVPIVVVTSSGQIGPLPSGGLLGAAGDTFALSASAVYVSIYGRTHRAPVMGEDGEEVSEGGGEGASD